MNLEETTGGGEGHLWFVGFVGVAAVIFHVRFWFPVCACCPVSRHSRGSFNEKKRLFTKKKNTSQTKSKLPINRWAVLQQDRLDVLCAEANNALQARRPVAESQRTNGRERKRILPQFEADVISFAHLKVAKKLDDSPVSLWETSAMFSCIQSGDRIRRCAPRRKSSVFPPLQGLSPQRT